MCNIVSNSIQSRPPLPILSIKSLYKKFEVGNKVVDALDNINLDIQTGEFVCLLGASGCGKSTLLRIMAGFEVPTKGTVEMFGVPITGPGQSRGMVFQDYGLFPWLTVRDNIAFGLRKRHLAKKYIEETVDHFINMVNLEKFSNYFPAQLSGGMKQRVSIARVLANECDILLMDEPFGALDALTREHLQYELLDIWHKTNLTIVFVTHSVEEAVFLADRVVVMSSGPGKVAEDIHIPLPRSRDISSVEFNHFRRYFNRDLSSHLNSNISVDIPEKCVEIAVVGAHLSGLPLHYQLLDRRCKFIKSSRTSQFYNLYALANTSPPKPGLVRVNESGAAIDLEIYAMPLAEVGSFLNVIPHPLGLGSVELEDGSWVKGFICEPEAIASGTNVSNFGGWKKYLESLTQKVV